MITRGSDFAPHIKHCPTSFLSNQVLPQRDSHSQYLRHVEAGVQTGSAQASRVSVAELDLAQSFAAWLSLTGSIPGPIEFSDPVLLANATPGTSHVSPAFVPIMGDCLRMLRKVLYAEGPGNQPILIAGSGTMGWDAVGANLLERGDDALVLNTGYFGDSFVECLEAYGAKVTELKAKIGGVATDEELIGALKSKKFKVVTITHVDTSTGVLSPAKHFAELIHQHCPDALVVLDAVCAVASEEIRVDAWGIDVVISATQKGLGAPPGLSVVMASPEGHQGGSRRLLCS